MTLLTVAFCTFKRAYRLNALVGALRSQHCPVPFEILAVNNASPDNTLDELARLQGQAGPPLRIVTESVPGIVPARNRVLAEAMNSEFLLFIDDDELPEPGWLAAAYDALAREGADCVGGRIEIDFDGRARPAWLDDEISGFLGRLDHGAEAFWIEDDRTPVWTGNIGYAMRLFRDDPALRFDARYNRAGVALGGGEDAMMFRALVARGARLRYRPDMAIRHAVEDWKLRRTYFLRLHFRAGMRTGRHALPDYPRTVFGIPPFLLIQALRQTGRAMAMQLAWRPGALRQAMNAAHALGCLAGYRQRA